MKIDQLRPCDCCGGKIAPEFQVIRVTTAFVNPAAVNETLGLAMMFGGGGAGLSLARIMGPDGEAALVAGDKDTRLMTELFLCMNCFVRGTLNLIELVEKRNRAIYEAVEKSKESSADKSAA